MTTNHRFDAAPFQDNGEAPCLQKAPGVRPRHRARALAVIAVTAGFSLAAGTARAQLGTGGTPGTTAGATLGDGDFFIGVQSTPNVNLTDYNLITYFNQANCQCDRTTYVFAALSAAGSAKRNYITTGGSVQVWIGTGCDTSTPSLRPTQCDLIGESLLTDFAASGGKSFTTTAKVLSRPHGTGLGTIVGADGGVIGGNTTVNGDPCVQTQALTSQTIFLLVDQTGAGTFTLGTSRTFPFDLTPPPAPASLSVAGGNEALVVSWPTVSSTLDSSGILGYQILCQRAEQFQVFADGDYKPSFESATTNCPGTFPGGGTVDSLDPRFVCSDLLSPAATSARIKILQNKIVYRVAVVAIDKHKNPSSAGVRAYGAPQASDDFYNIYRNDNPSMPNQTTQPGSDTGGYCAVLPRSSGRGWMAFPALGVAAAAAMLAARRRRRRP